MKHWRKTIVLAFALIFASCATTRFNVNVSSIAENKESQSLASRTYILLPGDQDILKEDLQFREFAGYVHHALAKQGYSLVQDPTIAQMIVFLRYGIGDPQSHTYTYSLPVYEKTGGNVYYSGSTIGSAGSSQTTGMIRIEPKYRQVGSEVRSKTYTTYFRWVIMDAFDLQKLRATNAVNHIWNTTITSEGTSGDLRRVFPVMIGAAASHIGNDTGKQIRIALKENDGRVKAVRATE